MHNNEDIAIRDGLLGTRNKGIQRIHLECDVKKSLVTILNTNTTLPRTITNVLEMLLDCFNKLEDFSQQNIKISSYS